MFKKKTYTGILSLLLLTAGLLLGKAGYAASAFPGPLPGAFSEPDIIGTQLQIDYTLNGGGSGINRLTINETVNSGGTYKPGNYPITSFDYALSANLNDAIVVRK